MAPAARQPLDGRLVVDFSRYVPGPFATRELLRLGARVVHVESPDGDPLRHTAPAWHEALNAGKESVVCDLKREPELASALCAGADVVVDGFRPGVLDRLGVVVPESAVLCSITGYGIDGEYARCAGHDLNYLGHAGVLADTAPNLPAVQLADLAAGGLGAVVEILAALLAGGGARIVVSMTHGSHRLVAHRLGGDPRPRFLTAPVPCYAIYATADARWLTVAALEVKFWSRLCELIERQDLLARQYDVDALPELAHVFAARPLAEWLELFDGEDVCVGPVASLEEASAAFGDPQAEPAPALGEHTHGWRAELAVR